MNATIGKCPKCERLIAPDFGGDVCPSCGVTLPDEVLERVAGTQPAEQERQAQPPGEGAAKCLRTFGAVNGVLGVLAAIALGLGVDVPGGLNMVFAAGLLIESLFAWTLCYAAASVVENVLVIRMVLEGRKDV